METTNRHLAERTDDYQRHLDQVSRSFAFCIKQLREPLKGRVALAYLLCRVLDTIEDSSYLDNRVKFDQIREFNLFMSHPPSEDRVKEWMGSIPPDLDSPERKLLEGSYSLFLDFHALPDTEKRVLRDAILSMSRGMEYFLKRTGGSSLLKLESMFDVNRYCFFVAGVVGEMLSKLVEASNGNFAVGPDRLLKSHQFGLFLQKINILKDQMEDEKAGRSLIPSQDDLWLSLDDDLMGAVDYLIEIPIEEKEYRLFCGWSLFLGLASVPWIKRTWARRVMDKIPRSVTEQVLAEVTKRIDDNAAIRELFERMRPSNPRKESARSLPKSPKAPRSMDTFEEFEGLYQGRLSQEHLRRLGMQA